MYLPTCAFIYTLDRVSCIPTHSQMIHKHTITSLPLLASYHHQPPASHKPIPLLSNPLVAHLHIHTHLTVSRASRHAHKRCTNTPSYHFPSWLSVITDHRPPANPPPPSLVNTPLVKSMDRRGSKGASRMAPGHAVSPTAGSLTGEQSIAHTPRLYTG